MTSKNERNLARCTHPGSTIRSVITPNFSRVRAADEALELFCPISSKCAERKVADQSFELSEADPDIRRAGWRVNLNAFIGFTLKTGLGCCCRRREYSADLKWRVSHLRTDSM